MTTFDKRMAAPKSIKAVMEQGAEEAARIRDRADAQQESISALGAELLEMLDVNASSLTPDECGNHAGAIVSKQREFVKAVAALFQPELLIANGMARSHSKPFVVEQITGALIGTEGAFQQRYDLWLQAQKEEEERQDRARAYAEEEAFEKSLRDRLRTGEDVNVEYERSLRRQQQTTGTGVHNILFA